MATTSKLQLLIDISNKLYNNKLTKMQNRFSKTMKNMKADFGNFSREIPRMGKALDVLSNKWVLMGAGIADLGVLFNKSVSAAASFESDFLHIRQMNMDKPKSELDS